MVNHICEPISSNQFASCSSARVGQGGGGAPLTVKKLWRHENFKRSWTLRCQFMSFFNCFVRELQSLLYVFNLSLDVQAVVDCIFFTYTGIADPVSIHSPRWRTSVWSSVDFP